MGRESRRVFKESDQGVKGSESVRDNGGIKVFGGIVKGWS